MEQLSDLPTISLSPQANSVHPQHKPARWPQNPYYSDEGLSQGREPTLW